LTDDGTWTGNITLSLAGSRTITATNNAKTGNDAITITAGAASAPDASISAVSPSPATAGSSVTITVTAYDEFQNALASGGATVVINVGGANTAAPSVTDNSDGTYTATYTPTASGTDNITGTINGPAIGTDGDGTSDGTYNLTVNPGAASYLKVTGTASMTAGATNELTITAYDASNNVATAYTGVKSLTFSGPGTAPDSTGPRVETTAIGTAFNVTFTAGVSVADAATLTAYKAESISVDVTEGSINSTGDASYDLDLTVSEGSANNLAYNQHPTNTVADLPLTPAITVQVRDQWNNVRISDSNTSVGIAINTNPPGDGTLSGTTPQTASSGIATFGDLSIDKTGDGYTLDATSGGLTTATSSGFNITSATIQFTSTSSSGAEGTTPANLELTLSVVSVQDVTVDYALSGTATGSGTDYTLAAGTAIITAGSTTTNISATIVDDSLVEANETIVVTISNPTNATLGTNTVHTYTISDNDASPTIQFTSASSSGDEGTTPVNLELTLSVVSAQDVSVDYAVTGGAATGSGTDYTLTAG
ncbi:hypothetical protein LCGC14_2390850, partial [marine sediment metagenome]